MKLKHLACSLFAIGLGFATAANSSGAVLLSDNFDNNTFNSSKWSINTSLADAYGTPKVVEQNQRMEISARGYLDTVTNYDPAALGGLVITGTWTFLSVGPGDGPKIVTRSSGTPSSYYVDAGEVTQGITFTVGVPGSPAPFPISGYGAATITSYTLVSNTLSLAQGDTVSFQVTDDGTNLTFSMTKVGNPAMSAYATATCTNHLSANYVSFYNREYNANQVALDNVVIQTANTQTLTNIVVSPAGSTIAAGSNLQFTATGQYSDGSSQVFTNGVGFAWSSSNPSVAQIGTNGLATGLTNGTTTISATSGAIIGSVALAVDSQPSISTLPTNITVSLNGSVSLSVNASGGGLSYQWLLNGTNISGATGSTLSLTNLTATGAGVYSVSVSNVAGSVTDTLDTLSLEGLNMYAGLTIFGQIGSNYQIDCWNDLNTNSIVLTNIVLPSSPYLFIDTDSPKFPRRYYRAVLVQ